MKDCCFTEDNHWFRYRAAALIVEDGKALFIGNPGVDYLYTVGGGVHLGETSEDCVRREVLEETGIAYEVDRLALVCENFFKGNFGSTWGMDCQCLEFYYIMKPRGMAPMRCGSADGEGNAEVLHWVPLDRLGEFNIKPDFLKERIPALLASRDVAHIITEKDR